MPLSSPADALIRRLAEALDDQRINYVVIGGQAVIQHGHVRTTTDVDLSLPLAPFDPSRVLAVARKCSLTIGPKDPKEHIRQTQVLPCHDAQSALGVDFSFVDSDYLRTAIDRADWFKVAGYPVRFLAIVDLLLQKVIANRPQDRIDVVELLVRHEKADFDYIRSWLRQFEQVLEEPLVERFDELKREADVRPPPGLL